LQTFAGPEIGVASTKAFTCQLAVLACLAIAAGRARGTISRDDEATGRAGSRCRGTCRAFSPARRQIAASPGELAHARDVLYLGRGTNYPLALEGALKLKEISYIHAEGYAAGELKHGPIALIDETCRWSSSRRVTTCSTRPCRTCRRWPRAAGASCSSPTRRGGGLARHDGDHRRARRPTRSSAPFLYALPVQLLAYHAAVFLGTDVDQPRNLAKSVTVE
jgi:glutamine---fructose-6-phosphate transaminase (isomerizing)